VSNFRASLTYLALTTITDFVDIIPPFLTGMSASTFLSVESFIEANHSKILINDVDSRNIRIRVFMCTVFSSSVA
jgi:hypothetical protein